MAKKKKQDIYYLDTASFSVQKVKVSAKQRILHLLGYFLVGLVFFGIAMILSFSFFNSPEEKKLKNELYAAQVQYRYLSKRMDKLSEVLGDVQQRDQNLYRIIFDAEPPYNRAVLRNNYSEFNEYQMGDLIVETSEKADHLATALYAQSKSLDEIYAMAKKKDERLRSMPAIFPINKEEGHVVSGFGYRPHPIFKALLMHTGIDIAAPKGTPIYATGDGMVEVAGANSKNLIGYGICCLLDNGFGYKTLYGHMSKVAVHSGQKVKRGDIIGYVGSTGNSTGSHLHYEVIVNGKKVDPVYYFFIDVSPEEYLKILEKSREINQSLS